MAFSREFERTVSSPSASDRCFRTPESILIDGANGVCRRPESHRPISDASLVFSVALAVASFVAFLRRPNSLRGSRPAAAVAMVAAIVLLAIPGLTGVIARRADAPAVRSAIAGNVDSLVTRVTEFARSRGGCVAVVDDGCVACTPVIRYALPDPHECVRPQGHVVMHAHSLTRGCREQGDTLICGVAP